MLINENIKTKYRLNQKSSTLQLYPQTYHKLQVPSSQHAVIETTAVFPRAHVNEWLCALADTPMFMLSYIIL